MTDGKTNNLADGCSLAHYRILKQLGAGGMGEVYLAEDSRLRRKIALKVLPEDIAADLDRLRRFEQEAFAASALNHPNILTIYDFGADEGIHFLAAEFIEGETLRERIQRESLTVNEVLDVGIQTASALVAAHEAAIIHRDIKPDNIMIRRDRLVKVLDFGLAKLTEKVIEALDSEAVTQAQVRTAPGVIMGTIGYMSPEQARGNQVDARTDIFSFGIMLYEMLAGKMPFDGENAMDVIGSILNKEPVPLSRQMPEVPREIERIINKALRKDREERYQTAKDLLIDLKDVKQDLEFQNKLERTASPNREEARTQIFNAATSNAGHTTSSAEYVVNEIKQHKRGFVAGLIIAFLAAISFGYWFLSDRSANTTNIESIAVLPFENQNSDTEYLSDGLTESVINNLIKLPNLRVITRNSVFRYKGKETDPATVGRELIVRSVLTGRIIQRGDNLIISAELTDLRYNKQIWGQQYNRKLIDAFALQQELSRDISETLRSKLTGEHQQQLAKLETVSPEAYQFYLKGRYHLNKRKPEEHKKAIQYFEQAIALDPNYALAYAGLADCYAVESSPVKGQEKTAKLRAAANKALELDSGLGEPYAALAEASWEERNWAGAERNYKRAIELNPNYASAHQWYGELLTRLGRHDEAISEIKRARELDPLSLIINSNMIYILSMARRYDEAIEQGRKTLEMDASWYQARNEISLAYVYKGMYEESLAEEEKALEFLNRSPESKAAIESELTAIRDAYRKSGARGYWQKRLEFEKQRLTKGNEFSPFFMAEIYASLGDKNEALKWLEKSVEEGETDITLIKVYPVFDNLRSEPRFQDLARRIGLLH
ncbi:MAG: protein kinase [Acidobacteriota bacterium]|nr:protein kinase [Acidobacteriota bacterium]